MTGRPNALNLDRFLAQKLSSEVPLEKLFIKLPPFAVIQQELLAASEYFYAFNLLETAKFCAELLNSLADPAAVDNPHYHAYLRENQDAARPPFRFAGAAPAPPPALQSPLLLVRSLFSLREFRKCAFQARRLLERAEDQSLLFYYAQAIFMRDCVAREETQPDRQADRNAQEFEPSRELLEAEALLEARGRDALADVNLFALALIKRERRETAQAVQLLVRVLNANPFFWTAWLELSRLTVELPEAESWAALAGVGAHWMKNFFVAQVLLDNLHTHERYEAYCYDVCCGLLVFFLESPFLLNFLAVLFFNVPDYDNSLEFFNQLLARDPFRYENTDVLSNLLYVKENHNELGRLALLSFENDKYLPETCCVLGNYYSLVGERVKAAQHFKRAIALDRAFLPAYILLGHELLELKNVPASIESYNAAVQLNAKDYRGWYGLGLAYELQHHFQFAIYYFLEAIALNPRDSRMWNAIGSCYEKMNKPVECARCLEKSEGLLDQEGISLFQLGKVYDLLGLRAKAVQCFQENAAKKEKLKVFDKELSDALVYLVEHYKAVGAVERAEEFANKLLDFPGFPKEEAHNIIYELSNLK